MSANQGSNIGPFQIVRELATGPHSRVFLAASPGGRATAVKVLSPTAAADPAQRERLRAAALVAQKVSGAYTASFLAADLDGQWPWLATIYIPGVPLPSAVSGYGPCSAPNLRWLAVGLAEALSAVHAAGLVHGALRPADVYLVQDGIRILGFGRNPAAPAAAGSPAADIHALGAILIYAGSGLDPLANPAALAAMPDALRPAIEACGNAVPALRPTPAQLLAALAQAGPPPILELPDLRRGLQQLETESETLFDAHPHPIAKDAAPARPGGPGDFREQLTVRTGSTGSAGTDAARRTLHRRRVLSVAAGGLVAGGVAIAAFAAARSGSGADSAGGTGTTSPAALAGVPTGPEPLWTTTPQTTPTGALAILGTVVNWGSSAFNPITGAQLWTYTAPAATTQSSAGPTRNFGVYGSTLVVFNGQEIFGVSSAGRQLFSVNPGPYTDILQFCATDGDVAVALLAPDGNGSTGQSFMEVIDIATGTVRWKSMPDALPPAVIGAGRGYLMDDGSTLVCINLATGAAVWSKSITYRIGNFPVLAGSALLVSDDQVLTALDPATGDRLWTASADIEFFAANDSRIFLINQDTNTASAVDAKTGKQTWSYTHPSLPALGPVTANDPATPGPFCSDAVVAFPCQSGHSQPAGFLVLDAASGKPLWFQSKPVPEPVEDSTLPSNFAVSGDTVFLTSGPTLYAYRAKT